MRFLLAFPRSPTAASPIAAQGSDLTEHAIAGATLFAAADAPLLQSVGISSGVVGQLFRHGEAMSGLGPSMALAIESSDGRFLVEHCWGRYIAFWRDRRSRCWTILRDPSGVVPLFHWRSEGWDFVFSDLDTARQCGVSPSGIDWEMVAHTLFYPQLPTARTCLVGIEELLPGEALHLADVPNRRLLWSPWTFAAREQGSAVDPAPGLRSVVADTIHALAQPAGSILLELSGGLDSSIIATCLADRADWRGVNLFTRAKDGDERDYARLAAGAAPLETLEMTADDIALFETPERLLARPSGLAMLTSLDQRLGAHASAVEAEAIFSGAGGDNIFCYLVSSAPVLDALRLVGRKQALRTAGDVARLTCASIWAVLGASVRLALVDHLWPDRWVADRRLLARGIGPTRQSHPWLARPKRGRTGTRAHLTLLLRIHSVLNGYARAARVPMLFPLLAQPVLEACLAIGSWRWVEDGRDRAVARRAFADCLPASIVQRRGKGRLESLLAPAFDRDRLGLRALLLDGELARQGLLDRDAIAAATAGSTAGTDTRYARILDLVDAELWARGIVSLPPA